MVQLSDLLIPLLALLLGAPVGAALAADAPRGLSGQVTQIVDGDTLKVRIGDRIETVRYIGMNAPEPQHPTKGREPGAREATEANRKLVEGRCALNWTSRSEIATGGC
jgi:micrococcal nuclease